MRLLHDRSCGAHAVKVPCYVCGQMFYLSDVACDLDGPAFKAYYCAGCLPRDAKIDEVVEYDGRIRAARTVQHGA